MATTADDIRGWLKRGKEQGATHVIVMCDTFDWSDYPVFIMPGDSADKYRVPANMQKPMECYDLSMDWDEQLAEHRANHWPNPGERHDVAAD